MSWYWTGWESRPSHVGRCLRGCAGRGQTRSVPPGQSSHVSCSCSCSNGVISGHGQRPWADGMDYSGAKLQKSHAAIVHHDLHILDVKHWMKVVVTVQ